MTESNMASDNNSHDLVIVSDLHLGEGLREDEQRYSSTEDFFLDLPFSRFLDKIHSDYGHDPSSVVLVLNGDVFDFLTVTKVPDEKEAAKRGFQVFQTERKFGLNPTAPKSVYKLDLIAKGHKPFFKALAQFISRGHRVEILRGNHDLELHFEQVRQRMLEILSQSHDELDLETAHRLVTFHEWFYLEPGRIFIEHGNQYDTTNSIRYPLRPILSGKRWWATEKDPTLDYPLGSIFVRFFYNRVRRLDPYTPRMLSFEQYLAFIRRYNLFDIWRVYRDHYPHFAAALGPTTITGSSGFSQLDNDRQEADFKQLESENKYGDLYRHLNKFKIIPLSASKPAMVREMARPIFRRSMWFGLFTFAAIFIWVLIFSLIDMIPWITANAFLTSFFMVLTLGGAFGAWVHLRRKLGRKRDPTVRGFVSQAQKVAELTKVKTVVMGHSHMVDYKKVAGGKCTYCNSGTWTSVDNSWNRIMRDARRMTFTFVKGDKALLRRWNDEANRFDQVPLFHLEDNLPKVSESPPGVQVASVEHSWLPSAAVSMETDFESDTEDY